MSSDPLVSIIVPVYRVESYLHRCMTSLLNQTHANVEIVLIDDGSPDNSGVMCDGYAAADGRVRVIHQDNAGPSAARNAGISVARGALLTFVDPDDWVHPNLVEHLVSALEGARADLAVCRFLRTADQPTRAASTTSSVLTLDTDAALQLYAGPHTSWMTSPCAKLFKATLFEEVRFPVGRLYEDEFTTYRLVAASQRIAMSEAELYFYFMRPGSATQGEQSISQLLDRVDALREQAEFFAARGMAGVSGNAVWRAFLILRQLRARVVGEGDPAMLHRIIQDTASVAGGLRGSQQSLLKKAIATVYAVCPQPLDAAIGVYRVVTGRPGGRA